MSFSDDKFGTIWPTRDGISIGTSGERKMLDAIGGSDGFRTRIRENADGSTTILRTKNGQPQFETSAPAATKVSTPVVERLCGIQCPAYANDYTLSSTPVYYVVMAVDGSAPVQKTRDDYYANYAFASRWAGGGKVVMFNGMRDGSVWQGSLYPYADQGSSTGWAKAARPFPFTGRDTVAQGESTRWGTATYKPPGSPIMWFPWDSAVTPAQGPYTHDRQFVDGYGATYSQMSRISKNTYGFIDSAFYTDGDLCYLQCIPNSGSFDLSPGVESIYGQLVNVTQGSTSDIAYGAIPSRGFSGNYPSYSGTVDMQSYTNMTRIVPLSVNGSGTRAVSINEARYRVSSFPSLSRRAVAAMDIDLVNRTAACLEVDNVYRNMVSSTPATELLDMGFANNSDDLKILCHYRLNGLDSALYLGAQALIKINAPDYDTFIRCVFSNIAQDLFVVNISRTTRPWESSDTSVSADFASALVVLHKGIAVHVFYTNSTERHVFGGVFSPSYTDHAIVDSNVLAGSYTVGGADSLPLTGQTGQLHSHALNPFDQASLGWYEDGPYLPPGNFMPVSATIDSSYKKIAISAVLGFRTELPLRPGSSEQESSQQATAISGGVVTINRIIDLVTGEATPFGSDTSYYNRLHYQKGTA